jgi:hypothetical protein
MEFVDERRRQASEAGKQSATKRRLQNGIDKAKIKDDEKLQPLAGLV